MKSQALQNLVKKIFGDEQTRRQFESNPDSVLSQFKLSEQERRAFMSTYGKLGLVTGGSQQLEATIKGNSGWTSPVP